MTEPDLNTGLPGRHTADLSQEPTPESVGVLADELSDETPITVPVVAVVGRPNVGKSTLVNRILGRREAVVQDVPGVTRDRVAYDAYWGGRQFTLVDTGGWEPDATGLQAMVSRQAEQAVVTADLVLFVVDSRTGATETDLVVARTLRRAGRPVVLTVTKIDDERGESDAAELWSLGLGEPYPVSGLHGRGSGDLLDAILAKLPDAPKETEAEGGPRRVALVGRPNVGKSSLLNRLTGEERSVVDSVAGTTVDPVDSLLELGDEVWRFVDTAGLRRRVNNASGMEYYASLRTASAIEAAEVAVVLLDASEVISEQDQRVISTVIESGRALVIAYNKWDLVDEDRREMLEREINWELQRVQWAPRVNVSAKTGRSVDKLAGALRTSLNSWDRRIPTGRLNTWLNEIVSATPPPGRGGKHPRVLFATQADTRPPRFVLFTTGFLESGYRRFIERKLREDFNFEGTPIEISVRVRERGIRGER
ncbi:MAG: GTPase [Pseudonocardiales bacterium]|nr:GTPase [Pseudonocardiales bacterium]